jgi:hypothetical protein
LPGIEYRTGGNVARLKKKSIIFAPEKIILIMKKLTFIAVFTVLSLHLLAQDYRNAIGVRMGGHNEIVGAGVTYKRYLSASNAIELIGNASTSNNNGYIGLSGEYLWTWGIVEGLSWFAGPGASVGAWTGDASGFDIALNGMVGLEYKFSIPLTLSVDLNPHFYFLHGTGFTPFVGALSVRYTF